MVLFFVAPWFLYPFWFAAAVGGGGRFIVLVGFVGLVGFVVGLVVRLVACIGGVVSFLVLFWSIVLSSSTVAISVAIGFFTSTAVVVLGITTWAVGLRVAGMGWLMVLLLSTVAVQKMLLKRLLVLH